jgi:hypothetical protein
MYKDRIKKWGFDKKNKERDMIAILRKKSERAAVGKETSFRVRGQIVTVEDVLDYFKRKKGTRDTLSIASTPSDISCWTPSPPQTPRALENAANFDSSTPAAGNDGERDGWPFGNGLLIRHLRTTIIFST